jgi:NTP pyrophosphatase (non-canonical NTP hydrolase)
VAELEDLRQRLRAFAREREWERFHDPKNLAMALAAESGELLEVFQWKTTQEVRAGLAPEDLGAAAEEIADVMIYLVRLADVLEVDLARATEDKIRLNAKRYPVDLSRGNAIKHDRRD